MEQQIDVCLSACLSFLSEEREGDRREEKREEKGREEKESRGEGRGEQHVLFSGKGIDFPLTTNLVKLPNLSTLSYLLMVLVL